MTYSHLLISWPHLLFQTQSWKKCECYKKEVGSKNLVTDIQRTTCLVPQLASSSSFSSSSSRVSPVLFFWLPSPPIGIAPGPGFTLGLWLNSGGSTLLPCLILLFYILWSLNHRGQKEIEKRREEWLWGLMVLLTVLEKEGLKEVLGIRKTNVLMQILPQIRWRMLFSLNLSPPSLWGWI